MNLINRMDDIFKNKININIWLKEKQGLRIKEDIKKQKKFVPKTNQTMLLEQTKTYQNSLDTLKQARQCCSNRRRRIKIP